ncbi:MAG: glycosyltransferase family 4 protein [Proteobacteria bacterium]|nr:glycosyltransferase family 4 protein [Pseudomonadota bacterium]
MDFTRNSQSPVELTYAVEWPRFGPYHIARLLAAKERLYKEKIKLVAIETASTEANYQWDEVKTDHSLHRVVIFKDTDYCMLSPNQIWDGMVDCLDTIRPDVVVVCGYAFPEALASIWWARYNNKGVVLMSDSNSFDAPRTWYREHIKRLILNQCDAALVAGTTAHSYIHNLGMSNEQIFIGLDVIDNQHFGNPRFQGDYYLSWLSKQPFFLCVSRFIEKKNLLNLLFAYANYCREFNNENYWRLVLIGDGPLKPEIEGLRNELDLLNKLILPGFLQYDQLPDIYQSASAFILPSSVEQWGLVANEAMASGLPVMVSRKAGCAVDLVNEGENGWGFDPMDVDQMTTLMLRMHYLPEQQRLIMGYKSKAIIDEWNTDLFSKNLLKSGTLAFNNAFKRNRKNFIALSLIRQIGHNKPL